MANTTIEMKKLALQATMSGRVKRFEITNEADMYSLYIDLETLYKESNLGEPFEYDAEADNGTIYKFTFGDEKTLVRVISDKGEAELIRRGDRTVDAIHERMKLVSDMLMVGDVTFGAKPPYEFKSMLSKVNKGDIITFSSGFSITIMDKTDDTIMYLPLSQKVTEDISLKNFIADSSSIKSIDLSREDQIRSLYRKVKDNISERATYRMTSIANAQKDLSLVSKRIQPYETIKFGIGEETFFAVNDGKKIDYVDKLGHPISSSTMLQFTAWAQTAPTVLNVYRTEKSDYDLGLATELSTRIQEYFIDQQYAQIYTDVKDYVNFYGDFTVDISTLVQQENDILSYSKNSLVATQEDGRLKLSLVKKLGDDVSVETIEPKDFNKVCGNLYHQNMQALPRLRQIITQKENAKVFANINKLKGDKTDAGKLFRQVKEAVDKKVDDILERQNKGIKVAPTSETERESLISLARAFATDLAVSDPTYEDRNPLKNDEIAIENPLKNDKNDIELDDI